MNCRFSGLKVIKTNNFGETMDYVRSITWQIKEKLKKLRETKSKIDILDTI